MRFFSLMLLFLTLGCKNNDGSTKPELIHLQEDKFPFIATTRNPSFLSDCYCQDSLLQPGQLFHVYEGTNLECSTSDGRFGLIKFDTLNLVKLDLKYIYFTHEYRTLNDTMELYISTMKNFNTDWNALVDRAEKVSYSAMDSVIALGVDIIENGGVDTEIYLSKIEILLPRWNDNRIVKYLEQGSAQRVSAFKAVLSAVLDDDKSTIEYYNIYYPNTCNLLQKARKVVLKEGYE